MRSEKFSLVEIVCIAVNVAFFHVYPNKHANPSPGILIVTDVYSLLWQPKTTTNQEKKFSIHFSLIDWMNEQIRDWTKNLTSLFHFFFVYIFFCDFDTRYHQKEKNLLLSPSLSHTLFFFRLSPLPSSSSSTITTLSPSPLFFFFFFGCGYCINIKHKPSSS